MPLWKYFMGFATGTIQEFATTEHDKQESNVQEISQVTYPENK